MLCEHMRLDVSFPLGLVGADRTLELGPLPAFVPPVGSQVTLVLEHGAAKVAPVSLPLAGICRVTNRKA
jgi:hypothetical protein